MTPFVSNLFLIFTVLVSLLLVLYYIPLGIWFTALVSGVRVTIPELILMRVRKTPPALIVQAMIVLRKGGVAIGRNQLETHYLAGGNLENVVSGLVAANKIGLKLTFEKACASDFKGINLLDAVKEEALKLQKKEKIF